jgi:hypothetical protein
MFSASQRAFNSAGVGPISVAQPPSAAAATPTASSPTIRIRILDTALFARPLW